MHLFLLLQDVNDQTVDVVPLPLQSSGGVLVHVQVRLLGQEGGTSRGTVHAVRGRLLAEPQHTWRQTGEAVSPTATVKASGVVPATDPGSGRQDGCMSAARPCRSTAAERGATWRPTARSPSVERQPEPPGKRQGIKLQ